MSRLYGRFVQMHLETKKKTRLKLELELVKGEKSVIPTSMKLEGLH